MMGGAMGAWMVGWSVLSLGVLALAVAGGIWAARALAGRETGRQAGHAVPPPGLAEAQAVLRCQVRRRGDQPRGLPAGEGRA